MVALFLNQDHSRFLIILTQLPIETFIFSHVFNFSFRSIKLFIKDQDNIVYSIKILLTLLLSAMSARLLILWWLLRSRWHFLWSRSRHLLSFSLSIGLLKFFKGAFLGFDQPHSFTRNQPLFITKTKNPHSNTQYHP